MSDVLSYYIYQQIVADICKDLAFEYEYWQGVDNALASVNFPPQDKETLYQNLAKNRAMPRPSEEDYLKCQKLEDFLYWGFMRKCQEYIDCMREKAEFDATEDKFLTDGMEENLRKGSKLSFETEKLMREYQSFQMIYNIVQHFPSAEECSKHISKLNLSEEEIIAFMKKLLGV